MSDRHESDDDRFSEPPTTFIGILEKSMEGFEGVLDEIREGIDQADEDHPLDPADPLERIRKRLEDADGDAVVIDVEKELETLREQMGGDLSDSAERDDEIGEFEFVGDDAEPYTDAELAAEIEDIAANLQAAANGLKALHRSLQRREDD